MSNITEHFKSCWKGKSYIIQFIEDLSGNGHDENGILNENNFRLRLSSEDFWMETLGTFFPYGLNEESKYLIPGAPKGTNFYPIGISGERNNKCHKFRNRRHSWRNFQRYFKDTFLKIRKKIRNLKKVRSKGNTAFLS